MAAGRDPFCPYSCLGDGLHGSAPPCHYGAPGASPSTPKARTHSIEIDNTFYRESLAAASLLV
jgi:hypothetical protein